MLNGDCNMTEQLQTIRSVAMKAVTWAGVTNTAAYLTKTMIQQHQLCATRNQEH